MLFKQRILMAVFCLLSFLAKSQEINSKVHSMFLYHFTKYVDWPENKKSGDFIIGVLGSSDIIKELEIIAATKKAGSQTIVIKKISNAGDAAGCHIVFIPTDQSSQLESIISGISGKPVLVVTEKSGLVKKGSNINFIVLDNKLKFEINKNSIESNGLKVSGDLLKLGIAI